MHFNPDMVEGLCFTCMLRGTDLCEKCMRQNAKKEKPSRWLNNNITPDPEFKKLWKELEEKR